MARSVLRMVAPSTPSAVRELLRKRGYEAVHVHSAVLQGQDSRGPVIDVRFIDSLAREMRAQIILDQFVDREIVFVSEGW